MRSRSINQLFINSTMVIKLENLGIDINIRYNIIFIIIPKQKKK